MNSHPDIWALGVILAAAILLSEIPASEGRLSCYQCWSHNNTLCPEFMTPDDAGVIPYKPCDDVYDAAYCVKTTGVTGGSLGTGRFCSSKDMGNYCEYIKRVGDPNEYRSCVYTCSGNGCNPADSVKPALASIAVALFFFIFISTLVI